MANVKLRVSKSPDSVYHVTVWKYSRGRSRTEAGTRAERLSYTAASLDSALVLGSGFGVGKAQKFRLQGVIVEIKVPVGRQIRFDESIEQKLDFTNVRISENRRWDSPYRNWNRRDWDEEWDGDSFYDWQPNVDYTMTDAGELVDLSKPMVQKQDGVYEYSDSTNRNLDSQIQELQRERQERIERQRRRVEEENRRLQELENSNTDAQENTSENTGRINTNNKNSVTETTLHTPVFSLLF
jgi:hypothetical protein